MAKFMKWVSMVILCVFVTSCYDNETIIIDEREEENLRVDDELTDLMKSVTSHDASFDDFIDGSHCFSINFPYQLQIDGELINITTYEDVPNLVNMESDIEIVYPISISLTNFETHNVSSTYELDDIKQMCNNGLLYEDHINCADFIYPLKLAVYNTKSRRFDKVEFNSNKETFLFLNKIDNNSIFEIVYPADIYMFNQNHFSIENNFSLSAHFKIAHNTCGIRD